MHDRRQLPNIAPTLSLKEAAELMKVHLQRVSDLFGACALSAGKVVSPLVVAVWATALKRDGKPVAPVVPSGSSSDA